MQNSSSTAQKLENHDAKIAVERAEAICHRKNARLTKIRRRVLELLWMDRKPSKTYDLLSILTRENASAKPPTVYRALDFLQEHGLVHKIESERGYIGCEYPEQEHPCAFLICEKCREVKECCETGITETLRSMALKQGFKPSVMHVEIKGTCSRCSNQAA